MKTDSLKTNEYLMNYLSVDGKWHPAANSAVCSSLPWPPWNASAGVPPVCLWWASWQADGASRHHCRGQRRGQVCHRLFLTVCDILWRNQLRCDCAFIFVTISRYGKLEELLEKSFPLVKMPSIQPVVMQVLKHLPKASVLSYLLKTNIYSVFTVSVLTYVQSQKVVLEATPHSDWHRINFDLNHYKCRFWVGVQINWKKTPPILNDGS